MEILKKFALDRTEFLQQTPLLEYALEVESITTAKVRRLEYSEKKKTAFWNALEKSSKNFLLEKEERFLDVLESQMLFCSRSPT